MTAPVGSFVRRASLVGGALLAVPFFATLLALAQEAPIPNAAAAFDRFQKDIKPILNNHCFECHAEGVKRGNVELDQLRSGDDLAHARDLWWRVLKNVRAGIMPPAKQPRLSGDEIKHLEQWIKYGALGI